MALQVTVNVFIVLDAIAKFDGGRFIYIAN